MCVNYYAPQDVRIEPMAAVPQAGEGEVLVKVEACAVCGSDMNLITHVLPMSEFHKGIEAMKSGDAVKVVLVP